MRTVIALLAFAGIAAADEPPLVAPPMVSRVARVVIPAPESAPALSANIFADYPDAKLLAALQPPAQPSRYTSPPGYHRHVATDGTVIEHSDSNNYKPVVTPAAHQNLVQSDDGTWPQYTGPRAPTVRLPYATGYCPPNRP